MIPEFVDRSGLKAEARALLRGAEVNPRAFVALYLGLTLVLSLLNNAASGGAATSFENPLSLFVRILTNLVAQVLAMGFFLYCMSVRRGQRAEFLTLFDGFSFAGRVVGLYLVEMLFILLWSMLFVIPGIVATYRYRFAYYNLCENPALGALDALNLSKKQTAGYKGQLFVLDLSYFGWALLASLPVFLWNLYASRSYISFFENAYGSGSFSAPVISPGVIIVVSLLCNLWSAAVALFYLPNYRCVDLGYYEAAKRTSGAVPAFPELPTQDGGPLL